MKRIHALVAGLVGVAVMGGWVVRERNPIRLEATVLTGDTLVLTARGGLPWEHVDLVTGRREYGGESEQFSTVRLTDIFDTSRIYNGSVVKTTEIRSCEGLYGLDSRYNDPVAAYLLKYPRRARRTPNGAIDPSIEELRALVAAEERQEETLAERIARVTAKEALDSAAFNRIWAEAEQRPVVPIIIRFRYHTSSGELRTVSTPYNCELSPSPAPAPMDTAFMISAPAPIR